MSITVVPSVVTGQTFSAANYNTQVRDNINGLWVATTAGDIVYATGAAAATRLALVVGGVMYGGAVAPAWLAKPTVDSVLKNTSAGTPSWKAVLELLSVSSRQGGSATDWNTAGTTTYTPTNQKVEIGTNTIVMSGAAPNASGYLDVTFPVAFASKPFVLAANMWSYSSSGVYDHVGVTSITASGFRIWVNHNANAAFYGNATIGWIAIGTP